MNQITIRSIPLFVQISTGSLLQMVAKYLKSAKRHDKLPGQNSKDQTHNLSVVLLVEELKPSWTIWFVLICPNWGCNEHIDILFGTDGVVFRLYNSWTNAFFSRICLFC